MKKELARLQAAVLGLSSERIRLSSGVSRSQTLDQFIISKNINCEKAWDGFSVHGCARQHDMFAILLKWSNYRQMYRYHLISQ